MTAKALRDAIWKAFDSSERLERCTRQDAAALVVAVEGVVADMLRGVRFRVETACDGYEHLMDEDVPGGFHHDAASYQSGAADAARAIRGVL